MKGKAFCGAVLLLTGVFLIRHFDAAPAPEEGVYVMAGQETSSPYRNVTLRDYAGIRYEKSRSGNLNRNGGIGR